MWLATLVQRNVDDLGHFGGRVDPFVQDEQDLHADPVADRVGDHLHDGLAALARSLLGVPGTPPPPPDFDSDIASYSIKIRANKSFRKVLTKHLLTIPWIVGFLLASPRSDPVKGAGTEMQGGGDPV